MAGPDRTDCLIPRNPIRHLGWDSACQRRPPVQGDQTRHSRSHDTGPNMKAVVLKGKDPRFPGASQKR